MFACERALFSRCHVSRALASLICETLGPKSILMHILLPHARPPGVVECVLFTHKRIFFTTCFLFTHMCSLYYICVLFIAYVEFVLFTIYVECVLFEIQATSGPQ